MRTVDMANLLRNCRTLTAWRDTNSKSVIDRERADRQVAVIKSDQEWFVNIGFAASAATFKKMREIFEKNDCKWSEISPLARECLERLVDEANAREFFTLTTRESEYFKDPRRGWEISIERFPNIVGDVEEAFRCFALSRNAAAIFHSVQVVEAGLIELGVFLKVKDPKSGWTAISNALTAIIKKNYKDRTRFERKNFAFLEQVHGTVEALKNAWRNKISHSHGKLTLLTSDFSGEIAEEILFSTRSFTRRLAEGLPPPKKPNATKISALEQTA